MAQPKTNKESTVLHREGEPPIDFSPTEEEIATSGNCLAGISAVQLLSAFYDELHSEYKDMCLGYQDDFEDVKADTIDIILRALKRTLEKK